MLLPDKHISFAESLLGFGSFVLENLGKPITVDNLWKQFQRPENIYPAYQSFDNLVLVLDVLFALDLVDINDLGELRRRSIEQTLCA